MALSMMAFCAGCARTDTDRLLRAGERIGTDRAGVLLPDYPADCRVQARAGVQEGDRLDVAVLRVDAALAGQNARIARCADWYDDLRSGLADGEGPK
jgi:hypothetical protein